MSTMTVKKPAPARPRPATQPELAKPSRPSFAEWAKKSAGIVNTGIGNLSTREPFSD
jgi:hypothetical protein